MGTFELLGSGFANAFALGAFLTIVIGLLVGVVAGALPGISFVNAMAMSLPFTYVMTPTQAMLFLGGIYVGGVFGGSISSIMINVPGTPASLPACWDGYPMTKKGLVRKALSIAIIASATGGFVSALVLAFASAPFATFALRFSQPEFFAAKMLGLISVIAIAKDRPAITMISLFAGIVIGSVGIDPLYGAPRFSFGIPAMQSGIDFVVVMIGLFAVSEVIDLLAADRDLRPSKTQGKGLPLTFSDVWNVKGAIARGTGIGCCIGVIPGAGATPAAVISYGVEKQAHPRGKGVRHGGAVRAGRARGGEERHDGRGHDPAPDPRHPGQRRHGHHARGDDDPRGRPGAAAVHHRSLDGLYDLRGDDHRKRADDRGGHGRGAVLLDAHAHPAGRAGRLHRGPQRDRRLRRSTSMCA